MAAMYATVTYTYQDANGADRTIYAGETRDSVTDSVEIAVNSPAWSSTAPTAATVGATLFGYLGSYARGTVS